MATNLKVLKSLLKIIKIFINCADFEREKVREIIFFYLTRCVVFFQVQRSSQAGEAVNDC